MATLAEIADHLDLSVRSVSSLKRSGILPDAGRGANDLDVCRKVYIGHLRETAAGRAAAYGTLDLTAERAALARAQTVKAERENKIADGEFLPRGEVHIAVTGSFARVRSRLLGLPPKLAPMVAPEMTPAKAQAILKTEIYAALDQLATPPASGWDTRNCQWFDEPIATEG